MLTLNVSNKENGKDSIFQRLEQRPMENNWTGKPLLGLIKEHFSRLGIKDPYNICLLGFHTCYTPATAVSPIFLQGIVIEVTLNTSLPVYTGCLGN